MARRKILLLNTDLEIGGTPTVVRELATRLNRSRAPDEDFEVEVACLAAWGPVADQLRRRGVRVTSFGAVNIADWRVVPKLIAHVRSRRIDTIFSFLIHANAVAAAAAPACDGVQLFQSIQSTAPEPRWHWLLQSVLHRSAEKMVVPSPSIARALGQYSRVPPQKIVVIPNAIDADEFPHSGVPGRNPRPYPVGFVGRLEPVKRIPDLLAAVARLGGLVHLHVFGSGSEEQSLRDEARRLGIESLVTFEGWVDRPQDALARVGLLVLPSQTEGFGLVLIEAMAARVPVVATDVPGIQDVVENQRTGLLVPPGSPEALAAAIRRVVEDEALRFALVERAAVAVRRRFSWPGVIERYRQVLDLLPDRR